MTQRSLVPLRAQKNSVYRGFRLGQRGLEPVGTPTREQWSDCLDHLMHLSRLIHWWIGDLLVYGEAQWGQMYDEMLEHTGYEIRTLRTLKWVAGQISPDRRRDDLTFAHHKEVAGLSPEQQDTVLARAAREGWTREMVRHAVNRLAYEAERPDTVVVPGLHHGDCLDVMQTLPDESVDLLLTRACAALDEALAVAATKLKPNSHVYILATWQTYPEVAAVIERYFELRNTLAWVRDAGATAGGHDNYGDQFEVILFAHKGRRHLNGRREGDVVFLDRPRELFQYLIGKSTQERETVLDPFMATGDTGLAAKTVHRGFVGIERDRAMHEQAVRRLAAS